MIPIEFIEKDVFDFLEEVVDQKSFLKFVQAMLYDREGCEGKETDEVGFIGDWANNTIFDFLEAASAWAEGSDFGILQEPELVDNQWKQFAIFLYCGMTYE